MSFLSSSFFYKNRGQEGKTGSVWGWYRWEGGRYKKGV
jgi:hypothetical protein